METIGGLGEVLKTVVNNKDQIKVQEAIIQAKSQALDVLSKLATLQEENASLREEIRKYQERADLADRVFYARHAYWMKDPKDGSAFCPTCFDTKGQLVRLMKNGDTGVCHICEKLHHYVYVDAKPKEDDAATYTPPERPREPRRQARKWDAI